MFIHHVNITAVTALCSARGRAGYCNNYMAIYYIHKETRYLSFMSIAFLKKFQ